jgi:iron complex transport system ATP-binding protein
LIQARDLWFSYRRGPPVLKGIDITVKDGGMLGIVGPNGSGKSTLLRCLSGVLRPRKGEVLLDGAPMEGLGPRVVARKVSFLEQDSHYGFDYTAWEIASTGRYAHSRFLDWGDAAHARVVEDSLRDAGALHLKDRLYSELSGGERQRVNIARCLAQGATTMLLDEPTHDLDIAGSRDLMDLIVRLNSEKGIAVVSVTHDLGTAFRTFPQIAMVHRGAIMEIGSASSTLTEDNIRRCFEVPVSVDGEKGTIVVL